MNRRADPEARVLSLICEKHLIADGDSVCVCFSGGADSTALLYILYSLRQQLHIELCACHLHHGIRGEEADRDADFCRKVCERLGIPFYFGQCNAVAEQKLSGKSLEETARDLRYAWFEELGKKQGIDLFATAHQKNDLAETVLQRLIRGTTTDGLEGIPIRRGHIIRPLLCCTRAEIEKYLLDREIPYMHDSTNDSEEYTRNYIRHTVLPDLEKLNPNVVEAISRLAASASEERAFFKNLGEITYSENIDDALLRRKIASDYFSESGKTLCAEQIERLVFLFKSKGHETIPLAENVFARYSDGKLCFFKKYRSLPELTDSELHEGVTVLGGGILRVTCSDAFLPANSEQTENFYNLSTDIPLRLDGICGKIRYRSRKAGDRLRRLGVDREVRKMMSEQKIPVFLRSALPCFYDDAGLLCVPFVGVADRVFTKKTGDTLWLRVELDERKARKESECL